MAEAHPANTTEKVVQVNVEDPQEASRIPGTSVAVMIFILLVAFACTGFSIMFNILDAKKAPAIPEKTESTDFIVVATLPEGVAARVNTVDIPESTITTYIEKMRHAMDLEDDEAWSEWLMEQDYSMDSLRDTIILYYINLEIIDQAAAILDITVTEDDIQKQLDAYVEKMGGWDNVNADLASDGRDFDHLHRWAKSAAQQEAIKMKLNGANITGPEFDEVVLVSIKKSFPEFADAESLDDIDPAVVEESRTYIIELTNAQAFNEFISKFQDESVIERSKRPSDLSYESDVDMRRFLKTFEDIFAQNREKDS